MAKDLKLQYRFKIHNILKLTEGYLLGEILAWKYSFDINICKILKSGKMFNWDSVNTWAHEWYFQVDRKTLFPANTIQARGSKRQNMV